MWDKLLGVAEHKSNRRIKIYYPDGRTEVIRHGEYQQTIASMSYNDKWLHEAKEIDGNGETIKLIRRPLK
jgi:hypothetical protein